MVVICIIIFLTALKFGPSRLPGWFPLGIPPAFKTTYSKPGETLQRHARIWLHVSEITPWRQVKPYRWSAHPLSSDQQITLDAWWNPITACCQASGPSTVTTHENYGLPGAPFTCIIHHRQLDVAKPGPLDLMVHITQKLGRVFHSVFALRSQF